MAKNYNTRTASLKATIADIRNLDAKQIDAENINLGNKNILEYIEESVPTIKHSQDTRETVYENDLWGQWVETKDDGTIVVHDDWVTNPNGRKLKAWNSSVKSVKDDRAYISTDATGEPLCNIQTEMIKDGYGMFYKTPLTSFSSDLSGLVDGSQMFRQTSLTSFSSDLSSLNNGSSMFYKTPLTSFDSDLSSLVNGSSMFKESSLTSFSGNLSSLVTAYDMFSSTSLTSFSSDLRSLVSGASMFSSTPLTSFSSDLSFLSNGSGMFQNTPLTSFSSDLSSLVEGSLMFQNTPLTSFSGDLSSLIYGESMFASTPLTSFSGDLSSLICGGTMFYRNKLTPQSVMYIVESIKNIKEEKAKYTRGEIPWVTYNSTTRKYSAPFGFMSDGRYVFTYNSTITTTTSMLVTKVGQLALGIDVTNDSSTVEQQLQTFAETCLFNSWSELKQEFVDKGWTVAFQYGGTETDITLSEDEQFRGVPVYARLIEVSEEDKDKAEYCTEDGTKYYNIDWGHDVTDYDQYQYFGSLLEACGYFGVIPVKYLEEN